MRLIKYFVFLILLMFCQSRFFADYLPPQVNSQNFFLLLTDLFYPSQFYKDSKFKRFQTSHDLWLKNLPTQEDIILENNITTALTKNFIQKNPVFSSFRGKRNLKSSDINYTLMISINLKKIVDTQQNLDVTKIEELA